MMAKNPKKLYHSSKTPKSKDEIKGGKEGKEDIMICKKCEAIYYYKSWHSHLKNYDELKKSKDIKFTVCPACRMIADGRFEGEVMVRNFPTKIEKELRNLIENFGERAQERDPLDRIISIEKRKTKRPTTKQRRKAGSRKEIRGIEELRVLTTENQLAQRLGEKVNEVFGKAHKVSISHSKDQNIIRVTVAF